MKMAYCLECGRKYGERKFHVIDSTNEKGDTVFKRKDGSGSKIMPSRVGVCVYCHAKEAA
jgi:hypothetical protein